MRYGVLASVGLVASCVVALDPGAEAVVTCAHSDDCPDSLSCLEEAGLCVSSESACVELIDGALRPSPDGNECDSSDGLPRVCLRGICTQSRCGDGIVDARRNEACDDGEFASDTTPDTCRLDCTSPRCGDGVQDSGEVCDDGNTRNDDACSADCLSTNVCGNLLVDAGEQCDDGNLRNHDGCNSVCALEAPIWRPVIHPFTLGRRSHQVVFDTARDVAVLFGGDDQGSVYGDTWEYIDDATGWTPFLGASPPARHRHMMVFDASRGRSVLLGGRDAFLGEFFADHWEFDGTLWQRVTSAAPMGVRYSAMMTYDSARSVTVLFGGRTTGADGVEVLLNDTWEYDGIEWRQIATATSPSARAQGGFIFDSARGVALLLGGIVGEQMRADDMWAYDGEWTEVVVSPRPNLARSDAIVVYDAVRDRTVLFSGQHDEGTPSFDDTWEFDGAGPAWVEIFPPTPHPASDCGLANCRRAVSSATFDTRANRLLAFGGSVRGTALADTWSYDGAVWTERTLPLSGPPGRDGGSLAFDSVREKTVLFGGNRLASDGGGLLPNDTWEFDGVEWRMATPSNAAPARVRASMAFDSVRGVAILFGGSASGSALGDTWQYDGAQWIEIVSTVAPEPRDHAAMVFDPCRGVVILQGGRDDAGIVLSDTWEFDGAQWATVPVTTVPPARRAHSMTYDPTTGDVLLYGGVGSSSLDTAWAYDGADWREIPSATVGSQSQVNLFFHAPRGVVTMRTSNTWELVQDAVAGPSWRVLQPLASPPPGTRVSVAFDSVRGTAVLFGGTGTGDETWVYEFTSGLPDELCGSGIDEDLDGLSDCADPDCAAWCP